MIVTTHTSLQDFNAWSGAIDTKNVIIEEGKEQDFIFLIEELYPNGLTATELNDLLWFDEDWIFETLGIDNDDEE